MSQRILLVEDEAGIRLTLSDRLRSEGYEVETAANGLDGFEMGSDPAVDLIILDVMLPGKNGLDICRDLRQKGVHTPVMMLTARGQTIDKVLGLKIGADDYLAKPFEMLELLARVEALLRRRASTTAAADDIYQFGDIQADFKRAEVTRAGEPLQLSAKEFHLLQYFLQHRGETLSREVLLHEVWGYDQTPSTRTVDVHVAWLRQKIEQDPKQPRWVLTMHGLGYKFAE